MSELSKYFTPYAIQTMEENNISIKALASRLALDEDLDKAFAYRPRGKKSGYPKWAYDKAKQNGISRQTLYNRVKIQGMTINDAVDIVPLRVQLERAQRQIDTLVKERDET